MTTLTTKDLKRQVALYEDSTLKTSIIQICNTLVPFFVLWYLAYLSLSVSYFLSLVPIVIAAGFLVRVFIIFHDCTHQSFFKSVLANKVLGTLTGVLTLFPFDQWRHEHTIHHATSGNLDKRGTGDIWTLTVKEYLEAPLRTRLAYRFYRFPVVMFGVGPIYYVLLKNRFNRKGARKREIFNTYLTNILIIGLIVLMCMAVGWQSFLLIHGSIFLIYGALGIWLFYVQHIFEDAYFVEDKEWEYLKAAVDGSSYYELPKLFQWLTGNIGYHHVHHLSPRIPNYNLEAAHKSSLPLQKVPTVTLLTSLRSLRFHLWDEDRQNFVAFKDIKLLLKQRVSLQG